MLLKNIMKILAVGLSAMAAIACNEIDVPNGQIPADYRETAVAYMGTYTGRIDGRTGQLTFTMNENGKVTAQYSDARGNDMLSPECGSIIGNLKQIRGNERGGRKTLEWAAFAFNPNNCLDVMGEELSVSFKTESNGQVKINTQLLLSFERYEDCWWAPRPGGGSQRECRTNYQYDYLNGVFKK